MLSNKSVRLDENKSTSTRVSFFCTRIVLLFHIQVKTVLTFGVNICTIIAFKGKCVGVLSFILSETFV